MCAVPPVPLGRRRSLQVLSARRRFRSGTAGGRGGRRTSPRPRNACACGSPGCPGRVRIASPPSERRPAARKPGAAFQPRGCLRPTLGEEVLSCHRVLRGSGRRSAKASPSFDTLTRSKPQPRQTATSSPDSRGRRGRRQSPARRRRWLGLSGVLSVREVGYRRHPNGRIAIASTIRIAITEIVQACSVHVGALPVRGIPETRCAAIPQSLSHRQSVAAALENKGSDHHEFRPAFRNESRPPRAARSAIPEPWCRCGGGPPQKPAMSRPARFRADRASSGRAAFIGRARGGGAPGR